MATSLGSRYILHEALGCGAMGQVFAGSIRPTGEPVAIKILRPEFVSDPEVVARFVQERTILMSIADPNVVRVIDLVVEGETLAIVMELVRGPDMRRQLRDRRTVPPAEALHLTGQLLRGMAAVHAAGIIHRDIKPENVLVDTSNGRPRLKLTDFGVARLSYGASLTKLSGVIGTPEYMAPELAEQNRATPAADVYSAGIVLYEMLCGRTPFAGGHPLAVLRRQVDQAPPVIPGAPAELWDRIAWMLAKDPGSRPVSAAEAYAALAPLESSLASWPALAPWAGPEARMPSQTVHPAGQADLQDHDGPAPHATVLRHRDRGAVAAPADASGPAPRPEAGGGQLAGMRSLVASPSSRRKRQARVAVLAVALIAVLGLVTTVAMAATHRPSTLRPAADGGTTTPKVIASSATASVRPTSTPTQTASAATVTPGPGSVPMTVPTGGNNPVPGQAVVTKTVSATSPAGQSPTSSSPSPSPSPSPTSSLSSAEQHLVNMLNANQLDRCTARPDEEGGYVLAAVNCSVTTSGPTLRPLAELLTAGSGESWFQNNTRGFTNSSNCVAGEYVGTWHNSYTSGPLGCTIWSNGTLRIVWVVGGDVALIAEGSDYQTMYNWWRSNACPVPSIC
jgi:serine/threonine protein kinase, bacterial